MLKFEVTEQQMQLIADALQEQPYKKVVAVIHTLQLQINNQQKVDEAKQTSTEPKAKPDAKQAN